MVCDHIEIAERGRTCEVCSIQVDERQLRQSCSNTLMELHHLQNSPGYGKSLVHVLTSLQKWAKDITAWDLIQGIELLTKPINQRFARPEQPRIAPFVEMPIFRPLPFPNLDWDVMEVLHCGILEFLHTSFIDPLCGLHEANSSVLRSQWTGPIRLQCVDRSQGQ